MFRRKKSSQKNQHRVNKAPHRQLSLETLETRAMLSTVQWSGGLTEGSWNVATNWTVLDGSSTVNRVPTAEDDVIIDSGAIVDCDVNVTVANLTNNGTLKMKGGDGQILAVVEGGTFLNVGTFEYDGGDYNGYVYAALTNTGTIQVAKGYLTVNVAGASGWSTVGSSYTFDNTGTINLAGTSLSLGGLASATALGTSITGTGGMLEIEDVSWNLTSWTLPTTDVVIALVDSSVAISNAPSTSAGSMTIGAGHTLALMNSVLTANVTIGGSLYAGEGSSIAGDVTVSSGGALNMGIDSLPYTLQYADAAPPSSTTFSLTVTGNVTNDGTIGLYDSCAGASLTVGGTLTNEAGGKIVSATGLYSGDDAASALNGNVVNSGTVAVNGYDLAINAGDSYAAKTVVNKGSGSMTVADGATLTIDGATLTNSDNASIVLSDAGVIDFAVTTARFDGNSYLKLPATATAHVRGSFLGGTTNLADFSLLGTFILDGAGTSSAPQTLEVTEMDNGNTTAGYASTFAYGTLKIGANTYVKLVDNANNESLDEDKEAGYVAGTLVRAAGSTLDLNGYNLYAAAVSAASGSAIVGQLNGANVAPTVTVALSSTSPKTNDTLTATATASDGNSDTVTLTYVWTVNGVVVRTTSNTSATTDTLDLSTSGNGSAGDVIVVTVTPSDGTLSGTAATATATVANTTPTASITTPSSTQRGDVSISYVLTDPDGSACSIVVEYSKDGGATWLTATAGTGGDGISSLTASAAGTSHTFVWASASDLTGTSQSVLVRVKPSDAGSGTAATSGAFTVDNEPTQIVTPLSATVQIRPNQSVSVGLNYSVSNSDSTLTGLGFRIYYNSSLLSSVAFTGAASNIFHQAEAVADSDNLDGDSTTDKYILVSWSDTNGAWPGVTLPTVLGSLTFTAAAGVTSASTTAIKFVSVSTAVGYKFASTPIAVSIVPVSLDIDGDGAVTDAKDGVLALRYMFGFRGDDLIDGYSGVDAANLVTWLSSTVAQTMLDVDGNGKVDALTDGLLIRRYLLGKTGDSLVTDVVAISPAATRTGSAAIISYIESYLTTSTAAAVTEVAADAAVESAAAAVTEVAADETATADATATTDTQIITGTFGSSTTTPGSAVTLTVNYSTSTSDATLTGLGLRIHYNSSLLTFSEITSKLSTGFFSASDPMDDTDNLDGDSSTDKYILISWEDANGAWPGTTTATLAAIKFTASSSTTGTTKVNFTASSTAVGYSLAATSASLAISSETNAASISGYAYVDANANGKCDAGEGLPGVTVTLSGTASKTTTTGDDGKYTFSNLAAGTYTVTETQPKACVDGGNNSLASLSLSASQALTNKNFVETALKAEYITTRMLVASSQPVGSTAWVAAVREALSLAASTTSSSGQALTAKVASASILAAQAAAPSASTTSALTKESLAPIVTAAIAEWEKAGLSADLIAKMKAAEFRIADLQDSTLGWAEDGVISVDVNAAGYGWFVDVTPGENGEYVLNADGELTAVTSAALNGVDLETVVAHELGHLVGLADFDASLSDLMSGALSEGVRRDSAASDAVFANLHAA